MFIPPIYRPSIDVPQLRSRALWSDAQPPLLHLRSSSANNATTSLSPRLRTPHSTFLTRYRCQSHAIPITFGWTPDYVNSPASSSNLVPNCPAPPYPSFLLFRRSLLKARVPYILSTLLAHTSAKRAAPRVLLNPLYSPFWTIR